MTRPWTRAGLLLLGAASLGGCIEEFQNPTILDSLRVLAAQVEPPEIRPDQEFVVTPLVYSPRVEQPEYRWAMCLLEAPFTRPLGGGGGGGLGGQNTERIPSEQGEPPPSCLDREDALLPVETFDDGRARFEVPDQLVGLLEQLLTFELPEIDPSSVPEEFRDLLDLPDQFLLAVLHGINVTVSVELSDGTETRLANKRIPIKLIPKPGPGADTPVFDAEPGPMRVEFGWDVDHLTLQASFPGGRPKPEDGYVIRVYLPQHYWDPETEAPAAPPTVATGPEGAQVRWFEQGAARLIEVDLRHDTPVTTVYQAELGADGGWAPSADAGLATATLTGTTVEITTDPVRLHNEADRALAFLVTLAKDGELVDTVPEEGWRYVHGGAPNANPDPPVGILGEQPWTYRPDGMPNTLRPQYPVVTVRGEVVHTAERRTWSWFTDRGEWESRRTRGEGILNAQGTDHEEAEDRENTWLPGPADDPPAVQWLVVRDGRGGTAWTELTGVLRPDPP